MAIENSKVIDGIGVEEASGKVVLTIADALDWSDESAYELLLQEKLNSYLSFIESGEMVVSYPAATGRVAVIDVVLRVEPSVRGRTFLSRVREVVEGAGIEIRVRVLLDS